MDREDTQIEDTDRGALRDDGQKDRPESEAEKAERLDEGNTPVVHPRDGRHPNSPETLNADKGAKD